MTWGQLFKAALILAFAVIVCGLLWLWYQAFRAFGFVSAWFRE